MCHCKNIIFFSLFFAADKDYIGNCTIWSLTVFHLLMHHIRDCLPDLISDYVPVINVPYTRLFTGPDLLLCSSYWCTIYETVYRTSSLIMFQLLMHHIRDCLPNLISYYVPVIDALYTRLFTGPDLWLCSSYWCTIYEIVYRISSLIMFQLLMPYIWGCLPDLISYYVPVIDAPYMRLFTRSDLLLCSSYWCTIYETVYWTWSLNMFLLLMHHIWDCLLGVISYYVPVIDAPYAKLFTGLELLIMFQLLLMHHIRACLPDLISYYVPVIVDAPCMRLFTGPDLLLCSSYWCTIYETVYLTWSLIMFQLLMDHIRDCLTDLIFSYVPVIDAPYTRLFTWPDLLLCSCYWCTIYETVYMTWSISMFPLLMHHIRDCLPDLISYYIPVIDTPYIRLFTSFDLLLCSSYWCTIYETVYRTWSLIMFQLLMAHMRACLLDLTFCYVPVIDAPYTRLFTWPDLLLCSSYWWTIYETVYLTWSLIMFHLLMDHIWDRLLDLISYYVPVIDGPYTRLFTGPDLLLCSSYWWTIYETVYRTWSLIMFQLLMDHIWDCLPDLISYYVSVIDAPYTRLFTWPDLLLCSSHWCTYTRLFTRPDLLLCSSYWCTITRLFTWPNLWLCSSYWCTIYETIYRTLSLIKFQLLMHHIRDCLLDLISDYVPVIDAPYTRLFTGPDLWLCSSYWCTIYKTVYLT